jgi:hypothetical protein
MELMRTYCVSIGTGSRSYFSLDKLQSSDWFMVDLYTSVAKQTSTHERFLRIPRSSTSSLVKQDVSKLERRHHLEGHILRGGCRLLLSLQSRET